MESDDNLREEYLEIIENQMKDKDPIETKTTFTRLMGEGHSAEDAKNMLADCIAIEVVDVIENGKTFNKIRYVLNLAGLPGEPRM